MQISSRVLVALLAGSALSFGAAACGSEDEGASIAEQTISVDKSLTEAATTTEAAAAPAKITSEGAVLPISTDLKKKPKIPKPKGDPPTGLVSKDIVTGKGAAAKEGDTVDVQYVGVSWSTGEEFDASWDRGGDPFSFPIGQGQVIAGWDQGVVGMKVGGRRELVIPADLGYGDQGSPPSIKGGETLVFVIDLKKIS